MTSTGKLTPMRLLRVVLILVAVMLCFPSHATETTIVDQYQSLVAANRWTEALPVIEEIVKRDPNISTSWFNYGVCLDALGRHQDAAKAFAKAYDLRPDDYKAQYRIFRSLALAGDKHGFISFAERESRKTPEVLKLISETEEFKTMAATGEFQRLLKKYDH